MKEYTFNFIGYAKIQAEDEDTAFQTFREIIKNFPNNIKFDDFDIINEREVK